MQIFLFIFTLASPNVLADVGCGPSPYPRKLPKPDTAEDTGSDDPEDNEDNEDGEDSEDGEDMTSNKLNRSDLALLFLPVIGLTVASRRKQK